MVFGGKSLLRKCRISKGYVSLATGVCLVENGNEILCADFAKEKVVRFQSGLLRNGITKQEGSYD